MAVSLILAVAKYVFGLVDVVEVAVVAVSIVLAVSEDDIRSRPQSEVGKGVKAEKQRRSFYWLKSPLVSKVLIGTDITRA